MLYFILFYFDNLFIITLLYQLFYKLFGMYIIYYVIVVVKKLNLILRLSNDYYCFYYFKLVSLVTF